MVIQAERERIELQLEGLISPTLKNELVALTSGETQLKLSHLLLQGSQKFTTGSL